MRGPNEDLKHPIDCPRQRKLITERYDDTERIIAEAEEAAFKEEIQEKTSADSEEERI